MKKWNVGEVLRRLPIKSEAEADEILRSLSMKDKELLNACLDWLKESSKKSNSKQNENPI